MHNHSRMVMQLLNLQTRRNTKRVSIMYYYNMEHNLMLFCYSIISNATLDAHVNMTIVQIRHSSNIFANNLNNIGGFVFDIRVRSRKLFPTKIKK